MRLVQVHFLSDLAGFYGNNVKMTREADGSPDYTVQQILTHESNGDDFKNTWDGLYIYTNNKFYRQ